MEIRKGTDRIIILIGPLAIKIAKIRIFFVLREFWRRFRTHPLGSILKFVCYPMEDRYGMRGALFGALLTNWKEFFYYIYYRNRKMMPTYFSFFGIFNLQKRGFGNFDTRDLWASVRARFLADRLQNSTRWPEHHFCNPENFYYDEMNTLKMVDYGDPDTLFILQKYPDLFEPFRKSSK